MTRRRELLVGFVVLASAVVSVVGTLWLQGRGIGRTETEVHVLVNDVGQLAQGNAVKFRGVSIGRVGPIEVEPAGDAVRIHLHLMGEFLPAPDAVVLLAPESLFGDWQAEIVIRSRFPNMAFYDVPPNRRIQNGVRVLGGFTLPDLSRLTAVADEVAQNLAVLTDRFDKAFSDETAASLAQAIDNMEELTATLRTVVEEESSQISGTAEQIRIATEEIASTLAAARSSIDRLDAVLASGRVDSILDNAVAITADFRGVSGDVTSAIDRLESTLTSADSTMASLSRIAARVEAGEGSIGKLLVDSTLGLRAEDLLEQMSSLLDDIRANPRKYVRLSIF
ncbi:MAG: MCE family protein [Gemmatimonadetes bacterium]|nr:MCE family protein [Gemmatimonadota bacterium]